MMQIFRYEQKLEGLPPFTATIASLRIRWLTGQASLSNSVFIADDKSMKKFDDPSEWKRVDPNADIGIVWRYVGTRGWERDRK